MTCMWKAFDHDTSAEWVKTSKPSTPASHEKMSKLRTVFSGVVLHPPSHYIWHLVFDEESPSSIAFRCQWCGVLPVVEDADQEHLRRFHDSWTRGTKLRKLPSPAEPASHWEAILCKRSHLMSTKDMTNECLPGYQIVLFRTTSWCLHTNLNTWTLVYPIQHQHHPIPSSRPFSLSRFHPKILYPSANFSIPPSFFSSSPSHHL